MLKAVAGLSEDCSSAMAISDHCRRLTAASTSSSRVIGHPFLVTDGSHRHIACLLTDKNEAFKILLNKLAGHLVCVVTLIEPKLKFLNSSFS